MDFRNYGALREKETVTAMAGLGISSEHVRFLGFPDGGLCALAARHLANRRRAYESPFTNRLTPPRQDQIVRGSEYRPSDLVRELERLLVEISPTLIAVTHQEDDHPDHCAAYIFTREAIDRVAAWRTRPPRVLEYLVHYTHWPVQSFDLPLPLAPPPGFPRSGGPWRSVPLTADEAAVKLRTLHAYTSQMAVIGPLLNSFARGNELFVDGRPRERAECWCDAETVAR
jgi:LmbE family N-acetylglucosaminyl deacetylase